MASDNVDSPMRDAAPKGKSRKTDPNAPIRKRRKRTVVSGASDDCFACSKRGARCDRRRPYCSQCLDLGRECSGYKTTLTWGVGVASRGKLRGQHLPVMQSEAQSSGNAARSQSKASRSGDPSSSRMPDNASAPPSTGPAMASFEARTPSVKLEGSPSMMPAAFDMSSNLAWTMDMPDPQSWSNTLAGPPAISGLPSPSRPMIPSNTSQNMTSEPPLLYAPIQSPTANYGSLVWPTAVRFSSHAATPPASQADEEDVKYDPNYHVFWNAAHSPSLSQLLLARSVGRTPRIRYLISYYAEVIAPMIVAFDTPTNPFRTHVIRLAMESEALQEAIATLATSNLRQRREHNHLSTERTLPARMSSIAHRALTDEDFQDRYGISMVEGYIREENHHRGMAVKALNADLADPRRRLSDSVLATLLVLCLFHGCDTGVAGFRAQFAGVTRLLAIRMRHSRVVTDELKWFIRMFSWFDTLTATTNDRDVQLRGTCLEISSITDGEWGLENLAGCDGRLFKLISQLGRLNLLSQDQEPNLSRPNDAGVPTASLPPNMLFPGWDTVVPNTGTGSVPEYGFSLPTPPQSSDSSHRPTSPEFWTEWYSLRQRLESWRFDPPAHASFPSPPLSASAMAWNATTYLTPRTSSSAYQVAPENLQDVYQISECFRHAALLYCERLAEPTLPSSHGRIQHLVQLAMHCIITVQSDVYLLWPLFIVGSECVQDNHRSIIRNRCKDISKDSGFINNLSCLELLERIWAEHSDESSFPVYPSGLGPPPPLAGGRAPSQAFRWSRVMQAKRGDGEYMVA
ncbi:transcriptional regulator family: Fungal Specific TF [Penicillium roqueforti]|nr:transcriptional regulator family: Fungal Specific TF [Penicillium roqueforti]KAI3123247.1 transcriptional regulator family: Fungal Specific TF [Penicillium roqueforti]